MFCGLGKSPPLPEFDGKFAVTEQVLGKKIDGRFAVTLGGLIVFFLPWPWSGIKVMPFLGRNLKLGINLMPTGRDGILPS